MSDHAADPATAAFVAHRNLPFGAVAIAVALGTLAVGLLKGK